MMRASSRRWILGAVLVSLLSWGLFGALSSTEAKTKASVGAVRADVMRDAWKAGRGMVLEGRYREAIGFLKKYLDLRPRSADAWYWLGRALEGKGDYDHAQYAYRRVMAIDPEYPALQHPPTATPVPPTRVPTPRPTLAPSPTPTPSPTPSPTPTPTPTPIPAPPRVWVMPTVAGQPPSPSWRTSANFMLMAGWQSLVNRAALNGSPRTPIAWNREPFEGVYAWSGKDWIFFKARPGETVADVMQNNVYLLTRLLKENRMVWREEETPSWAQMAITWGYLWVGILDYPVVHPTPLVH